MEVLGPLVGSSRPVDAKFGSIWSLRSPSSGSTYATVSLSSDYSEMM